MKKKTLTALLVIAAMTAMPFTAFAEEASSAEGEAREYRVAFCHQHMSNSFQTAVEEGSDAMAAELGMTVTHFDAGNDASTQIGQIEQCISEEYDAIVFEPADPDGMVDVAKRAVDAGIFVINFSSTVTGWDEFCDGYAGAGHVEAGEIEMQHVADLLGGEGKVAILTAPQGDAGGALRHEGYDAALEKNPGLEVVVETAADWDTSKAQATTESWLSAYDLDAIVCMNDGMAVGAGNAAGADSGIVIVGMDASEDGLEAIDDGRMTGTVAQDAATQGSKAIQLAYDLLTGAASGKGNIYNVENIWVDADNIEAYRAGELNE